MLEITKLKTFLLAAGSSMVLLSCTHLTTPSYKSPARDTPVESESTEDEEYVSQSDYSTSQELFESRDVLKITNSENESAETFFLKWPIKDVSISQHFKPSSRRPHLGLDLTGKKNTPILAAHKGLVIYAGSGFRGYGRMIILEFNDRWATLYAHMTRLKVKTGQRIRAGQVIGLMGRTGRATGVHLHFELMKDKIPVDPIPYLDKIHL